MRLASEVAHDVLIRHKIQPESRQYEDLRWRLVAAINDDRRERADMQLIMSTRDGSVRTSLVNNTMSDLLEVLEGYAADGYQIDDLIIEGITR